MHVEDLDISPSKIGETAQRIVDRAIEEARRREHALLTNEHIFLAFAQVEWDMFAEVMRDIELNPHAILQAIEEHLHMMPSFAGRELRVSPATKLVFKLALHHASRAGRQTIEAADLFSAVFEETQGVPVSILRRHGVEPEVLVSRLTRADARHGAARRAAEEALRAAAVPEALRDQPEPARAAGQAAAGVRPRQGNPAGARDPLPPRARQLGDADRRAGRRQDGDRRRASRAASSSSRTRVPVRLRDCQVVNLQMNTMVAGTMLRGMFEDRIQNVIRELKERPNLILFVDEAHTMVGAGSALGAPSDAANVFKSVLARGEIRMVAATTLSEYKEYIQEDEALARRFRCVHVCEPTHRRDAPHPLQPAAASRAQLLGAPARRGDRDRARDVAALHAAPAPAGQGDRLARHRRGARRNRSPLGSEEGGHRRGDLARGADSRRHGVPRRHRSLQGHRSAAAEARRRPEEGRSAPWRVGSC